MIALALASSLALAPPESAVRAKEAYDEDRYEDAVAGFADAYAETQDIAYLFAQGQSYALLGDCDAAVEKFEAYLAHEPGEEGAAVARDAIAACRPVLTPTPPPPAGPDVTPDATLDAAVAERSDADPRSREASPATDDRPHPRPWHRDPWGGVLAGLGIAGLAAGTTLAIVARTAQRKADRAADINTYGRHNDRAVALSTASVPVLVVGGALLVGAALRYGLLARRGRAPGAVGARRRPLSLRF